MASTLSFHVPYPLVGHAAMLHLDLETDNGVADTRHRGIYQQTVASVAEADGGRALVKANVIFDGANAQIL